MSKQQKFIARISKDAQDVEREYGVPASIVIAQAILESQSGEKAVGNNLFGIKAGSSWGGAINVFDTHEVENGERVKKKAAFRAYDTIGASLRDYGKLLSEKTRYAKVLTASTAHEAADELQRAGYATDPEYAAKIKKIIDTHNLTQYDDKSYDGYVKDDNRIKENGRRLADQRKTNPGPWDSFMKMFEVIWEAFAGLVTAIFGGDQKVASAPLPTPTAQGATNNVPARA